MARARSNPNWALRICLVALVLSVAWFVTRPKPLAGWLSVQADSHAVLVGQVTATNEYGQATIANTVAAYRVPALDLVAPAVLGLRALPVAEHGSELVQGA